MKDTSIEELFRNGLQNSESDVPAGTWKAIENSLESMLPATGAASQPASSLGALGKVIIGGIIVSGVALTVYLLTTDKEITTEPASLVERAIEVKNETTGKVEAATKFQEPNSIKAESAVRQPAVKETVSQEVFSSNDEIKPLADQSEIISTEAQIVEALPKLKEPVAENISAETVNNEPAEPIFENSAEQIVAENSLLPEVSFNDVMTPNFDNVNDIFRVEGNEAVMSFTVTVMNLNGKVIHQWSAPNGFWDGRLENGQMAPSGKYLVDIFVQPLKGAPYHKPVTIKLIR